MPPSPDSKKPSGIIDAYLQNRTLLLRYLISRTRDRGLAEDVVQELYVKLVQARNMRNVENPTAFLFQSARNIWLNHVRSQVRGQRRDGDWQSGQTPLINNEFVSDAPSAEMELAKRQQMKLISDALNELPEKTRTIFVLHRIDGLKLSDIAERLGVSRSSVDKHLASGLRHVALRLNAKCDGT